MRIILFDLIIYFIFLFNLYTKLQLKTMNCPRAKNISLFLMFTLKHFQKIKFFIQAIKIIMETLTQTLN